MSTTRIIGIDFGTSTSSIRIKTYQDGKENEADERTAFVKFNNNDIVPSLIYEAISGNRYFGYEAKNAAEPGTLKQNFKLGLISTDPLIRRNARADVKSFMQYIFIIYQQQRQYFEKCDREVTRVSYPAKWAADLRLDIIQIARDVGFQNVEGVDEPTAAMYALLMQQAKKLELNDQGVANLLIVDMGAGTTDLVLGQYHQAINRMEILNIWPKAGQAALCGGSEIDERLCAFLEGFLKQNGITNLSSFHSTYLDSCKSWKEEYVSKTLAVPNGQVRFCGFIDNLLCAHGLDAALPNLDRLTFYQMIKDIFEQVAQLVRDCLDDVDFDPQQLDYLVLTGGHSQWYFWESLFIGDQNHNPLVQLDKINHDPKRLLRIARPQDTVSLGLVYMDAVLSRSLESVRQGFCIKCGVPLQQPDTQYCPTCAVNGSTNETMLNNAMAGKQYTLPSGKTSQGALNYVEQFAKTKLNMDTQLLSDGSGAKILQLRAMGGSWRQLLGLDTALAIHAQETATGIMTIRLGEAKWVDKIGAMAVSMFILWPLFITSGIGMVIQGRLPKQIYQCVEQYLNQ